MWLIPIQVSSIIMSSAPSLEPLHSSDPANSQSRAEQLDTQQPRVRTRRDSVIAEEEYQQVEMLKALDLHAIPEFKRILTVRLSSQEPIPASDRYTYALNADGDTLTIAVDYATQHRRLILKTSDPEIISALPNKSDEEEGLEFSLIGGLEQQLQVYQTRIDGYRRQAQRRFELGENRVTTEIAGGPEPKDEYFGLSVVEREKARIIAAIRRKIPGWKAEERRLGEFDNVEEEEAFRNSVIEAVEDDVITANRIATNNFAVGEGFLNSIAYDLKIFCQNFKFNRHANVTLADQNDFSEKLKKQTHAKKAPAVGKQFLVWNSDENGHGSDEDIETALFTIVKKYNLRPNFQETDEDFITLHFEESSRIGRLDQALDKIKQSVRAVADYFATDKPALPEIEEIHYGSNGIVHLRPSAQLLIPDRAQGKKVAAKEPLGLEAEKKLYPTERDLFIVANLPKRSLFWWHRVVIQLRILGDKIPIAFRHMLLSIQHWLRDVWRNFNADINAGYIKNPQLRSLADSKKTFLSAERIDALNQALEDVDVTDIAKTGSTVKQVKDNVFGKFAAIIRASLCNVEDTELAFLYQSEIFNEKIEAVKVFRELKKDNASLEAMLRQQVLGLLQEDETLEQFIQRTVGENYQTAKAETHKRKIKYKNPVSLGLYVAKAFGNFFRHHSEKHPVMGTCGLAAYAFGVGAVAVPAGLAALLSKLHLGFLTAGIQPSQSMASFLASGPDGRAIAAGFTYWKMIAVAFDADSISIETVKQLQEDPVSLAFILGIAIGLGYGTSKMIPVFEEELGSFRLYGWLVLGLKVGAGLADVVYNPRSNVISDVLEWTFSIPVLALRTVIDPIVETWRFEKNNWILRGTHAFFSEFFALLDYLFAEYPDVGLFTAIVGIIGTVLAASVATLGFLLPRWLTTDAFTEKSFANNTLFQFGITLFKAEGYTFLPKFFEYDCYDDYFVLHPARVLGRLFTALVNFLLLLFYIITPILKLSAFFASFVLPSYFTSEPFKKSMQRLLPKLGEGLDALFNIILTALKMLFDEVPGFLHIVYRGIVKIIAKTLGTLGDPGMLAALFIRFGKRKLNNHVSTSKEDKFRLRFNPNYGMDRKAWEYIDSRTWPLLLCLLFTLVFGSLVLVKDIIKNILLFITDIICIGLRSLVSVFDFVSRGIALTIGGAFKLLDMVVNPDQYIAWLMNWDLKYTKDTPVLTLGYLFRELGKETIYLTDAVDRFFGEIKRSFLSAINRAEIESQRLLCPVAEDRVAADTVMQKEKACARLAQAVINTGGDERLECALRVATGRGQVISC